MVGFTSVIRRHWDCRTRTFNKSVSKGQLSEEDDYTKLRKLRLNQVLESRGQSERMTAASEATTGTPAKKLKYAKPGSRLCASDYEFVQGLEMTQQNFCLTDPKLPDNLITFVWQAFLNMTGYHLNEILGRNCRFLQGPGTDQSAVQVIRKGIEEGVDTSVCLLNYKADGTPFWNQFFVAALRDADNNVVNYVGVSIVYILLNSCLVV